VTAGPPEDEPDACLGSGQRAESHIDEGVDLSEAVASLPPSRVASRWWPLAAGRLASARLATSRKKIPYLAISLLYGLGVDVDGEGRASMFEAEA